MKKNFIYVTMALFLAACSPKESGDKQAELAALKKERTELDNKIKTLEAEIAKSDTSKKGNPELVVVTEIQPQAFAHYIEIQGRIDADENVLVTPEMPGIIKAVYVVAGQSVSKGQLLAELDNESMRKNIETMETQLGFAKDMYAKQKALWDQKIGSEVQYLSAKNNVETLEKNIAAAREQLNMSKLTSPISGLIDNVDLKAGQIGSPGFQGIRVVNMNSLKAKGEVSESHSNVVSQGDNAKIIITDLGKEIDTKVSFAARVINPQSRTFTVEARINGENDLKPNMIAVIKIADYEVKDAIVVDLNMIQRSTDASFLYVAAEKNGKQIAQRRQVVVGKSYDGHAEITSGIQKGDRVITSGYQNLIDGQEIKF
jgi:RND family efflux transporter MFP subunit